MAKKSLIIATRESPLALWQANCVKNKLTQHFSTLDVQLLGMTTQADRRPYQVLYEIGGKGLFVKELEEALLEGRADCAVHSMKDVPMGLPKGLVIETMLPRENPYDGFVSNKYLSLKDLPPGKIIGTSSLRRIAQLLQVRPDLKIKRCRGNVNTRLAKLDAGEYDAIILAVAGLKRLNLESRIREILPGEYFLPQAGQGVLGIECKDGDAELKEMLKTLNDDMTNMCVSAERAMCRTLNVGCQTPVAAYAEYDGFGLNLTGMVASVDGEKMLTATRSAKWGEAEFLGKVVAEELIAQGAIEILSSSLSFRWDDDS